MRISNTSKDFVPHPPYVGQAVCVDVTEPKEKVYPDGKRGQTFKLVFETKSIGEDGKPQCVWSQPFTPTLHEKGGFRKFVRLMRGRDFTKEELDDFETDSLIGTNVQIVIVHQETDSKIFANIASATPWSASLGPLMAPSGHYKRQKDRPNDVHKNSPPPGTETVVQDYLTTKVHVGKNAGVELRELSRDAIQRIIDVWLPTQRPEVNPKPTADDRRLAIALQTFLAAEAKAKAAAEAAAAKAADNTIPMDDAPF